MSYLAHGRCRSGRRWFWFATLYDYETTHRCDDPICEDGLSGHAYGWEDTEDLALTAMSEAVRQLGGEVAQGCYRGNAPGRAGFAAQALKRINAAKRKARPPSWETDASVVEYLYEAHISWAYDGEPELREIRKWPIARTTAKRIYFTDGAYISRADLEDDTRCPGGHDQRYCEHGNYSAHGEPAGQMIKRGRGWWDSAHLFTTREAAEDELYSRERERQRERAMREPELKRLRREMADAHPDRGGTAEQFMAARKRYEQSLRTPQAVR
jgi:hypothetical protein